METRAFLEAVQRELHGEVVDESAGDGKRIRGLLTIPTEPHLDLTVRGCSVKLDFIIRQELVFRVFGPVRRTPQGAPAFFHLRPPSFIDRFLAAIGINLVAKLGDPVLDATYQLTDLTQTTADALFTTAAKETLRQLLPIGQISVSDQGYSLLKEVEIDGAYRPTDAIRDLQRFIDLVTALMPPPPPPPPPKP